MFYLFLLSTLLSQVSLTSLPNPYTISINSFSPNSCTDGTLICMGSVTSENGYLNLTPEPENGNSTLPLNMFGRVLFNQPVAAWPATFTTTFTVRISKFPNSTNSGDGLAFIMAQDNRPSPPLSFGSYLGIMDANTKDGVVRQLAVELDTYMNEFDPDGNHIGIDTTSLTDPVAAVSLNSTGIDLKSGKDINVKIDYDGWAKILQVSVKYVGSSTPLMISILNQSILMSETVPSSVYVGFTGSTGSVPESHQVLNWVFTSIPLPKESLKHGQSKKDKIRTILAIVFPVLMVLLITACCFFPFFQRKLKMKKEKMKKKVDIESRARTAANVPKMYSYKQLQKATHNFSKENLLGRGGFGSVYKGTLSNPPEIVAVKKISATSHQGLGGDRGSSFDDEDQEQVKRTLIVGLACLHPDCTFRPKIRKAVQVFLNPNEPLMDLPESRPSAVYVSVSSSSGSITTTTNSSLQPLPVSSHCLLPDHDEYTWHMDYTVQHGDTWKEVSSKFGSFVVEKPAKTLIPSQIVTLDLLCGCSDQSPRDVDIVTYRIESGDTLFTICSRFMADVNETAKLNGLTNPNLILAGDVMFIPGPAGLQKLTLPEDKDPIVQKRSKFQTSVVVVGSTVAAFTIIILVAVALVFWKHYKRNGNQQSIVCRRRADFVHCYLDSCPFHKKSEGSAVSSFSSEKATVFPYREVCDATSNFSMSLKIGKGSYGSVYRGKLKGTNVAIKQMKNTMSKEFLSELNILCKVRHSNLIELIGYAAGGDSLFLVYEYAQNGALNDHLHKPENRDYKPLPWTARVQIALDVAKGLEHIHECTKPYYVHRDVKTSNILLDSNFRAKIADFGLVKLLEHSPEVAAMASRIVGTFGYLAPEYIRDGCVTTKSDVYSFGVVLMELITGQPAVLHRDVNPGNDHHSSEHRSLVDLVLSTLNATENIVTGLTNLLDPNLTYYHKDSIIQMGLLAKDCVDNNWRRRPDMSNVAIRLSLILISSKEWEKEECIYKSWHCT
ncbi:hypothetical protein QYF36_026751 [Acer negundo]|nr:hypothetical protein QYF36_026751 [Acer negundo]